jgi:hypothetical protein
LLTTPNGTVTATDVNHDGKAKLPHGLTVQELKEMTKARLQAEKEETFVGVPQLIPAPMMPQPRILMSPSSMELPMIEPRLTMSEPPRVPLTPPAYYSARKSPFEAEWSEAWETASVSTVASDYLGSEYSNNNTNTTNLNSSLHEDFASFANRSRSFTTPWGRDSPYHLPIEETRRRAFTMSPRAGLSHLHEDRPLDLPTLPTFHPILPVETNRSRTHSATSLPTDFDLSSLRLSELTAPTTSSTPSMTGTTSSSPTLNVTGLADVFRVPEFTLSSLHEPRGRSSTWTMGDSTWGSDRFGPSLIAAGHSSHSDDMDRYQQEEDDLGTLLRLSSSPPLLYPPPGL